MEGIREALEGVEILFAIPPWLIPSALTVLGALGGAKTRETDIDNANTFGENQFDLDVWSLLAQIAPQLGRDQQLDPVRNATISNIGGEFFPGVDSSVWEGIRTAGPRPGIPDAPSFNPLKPGAFGWNFLSGLGSGDKSWIPEVFNRPPRGLPTSSLSTSLMPSAPNVPGFK